MLRNTLEKSKQQQITLLALMGCNSDNTNLAGDWATKGMTFANLLPEQSRGNPSGNK